MTWPSDTVKISFNEFDEGSYLEIVWGDAKKRIALSGDQALATGGSVSARQEGTEVGDRLRSATLATARASVAVTASSIKFECCDAARRVNKRNNQDNT